MLVLAVRFWYNFSRAWKNGLPRTPNQTQKKDRGKAMATRKAFHSRLVLGAAFCLVFAADAAVKVSEAFGYDPEDSTRFLQAALDSPHEEIVVDAKESPWVARPLKGRSGKTIIFEDGAWIRAKRGSFKGKLDILMRFDGCTNVTLRGVGGNPRNCGLRMWRDDYADTSRYSRSEWRHAVALYGCAKVTIEGLSLIESGGDGLYVASGGDKPWARMGCIDVKIRNCVIDRNYRQGISVIGVDGFLVEDTELTNTKGLAPQAGIDFEPNRKEELLKGIVMRRCLFAGNEGSGIHVFHNYTAGREPADMLFEDCRISGNKTGYVYLNGVGDQNIYSPCGEITLRRCSFADHRREGIHVNKLYNAGGRTLFERCTLENCCTESSESEDISLSVTGHDQGEPDVVEFRDVTVKQPKSRPVLSVPRRTTPYRGIPTVVKGEIKCVVDGKETVHRYDEQWRKSRFKSRDEKMPPPLAAVPAPLEGVAVEDCAPGEMLPCSALFVRGKAKYVFHAAAPGPVRFKFVLSLIGRKKYASYKMEVTRHGQKKVLAVLDSPSAPEGGEVVFDAPEAGFYTLAFGTGNGMAMLGSTVPVALDATSVPVHLVAPGSMPGRSRYFDGKHRVWAYVGAGEKFEFRAITYGAESVGLEMFDPDGKSVARVPTAEGLERLQPEPREGLWAIELSKPTEGAYEDHEIEVRGVPGWLFTCKGRFWRAAK